MRGSMQSQRIFQISEQISEMVKDVAENEDNMDTVLTEYANDIVCTRDVENRKQVSIGGYATLQVSLLVIKQLKNKYTYLYDFFQTYARDYPLLWQQAHKARAHIMSLSGLLIAAIALREQAEDEDELRSFFVKYGDNLHYEDFFQDVTTIDAFLSEISELHQDAQNLGAEDIEDVIVGNRVFQFLLSNGKLYMETADSQQFFGSRLCDTWLTSASSCALVQTRYELTNRALSPENTRALNDRLLRGLAHLTDHILCSLRERELLDPTVSTPWIDPFIANDYRETAEQLATTHGHYATLVHYYLKDLQLLLKEGHSRQEAVTKVREQLRQRQYHTMPGYLHYLFKQLYTLPGHQGDLLLHATQSKVPDTIDQSLADFLSIYDPDNIAWLRHAHNGDHIRASLLLAGMGNDPSRSLEEKCTLLQLSVLNSLISVDKSGQFPITDLECEQHKRQLSATQLELMLTSAQTHLAPLTDCGEQPHTVTTMIMKYLPEAVDRLVQNEQKYRDEVEANVQGIDHQARMAELDNERWLLSNALHYLFKLVRDDVMGLYPVLVDAHVLSTQDVLIYLFRLVLETDVHLYKVLPSCKSDTDKMEAIQRIEPMVRRMCRASGGAITLDTLEIEFDTLLLRSDVLEPSLYDAVATIVGLVRDEMEEIMPQRATQLTEQMDM